MRWGGGTGRERERKRERERGNGRERRGEGEKGERERGREGGRERVFAHTIVVVFLSPTTFWLTKDKAF